MHYFLHKMLIFCFCYAKNKMDKNLFLLFKKAFDATHFLTKQNFLQFNVIQAIKQNFNVV